jgi:hypothetical protein
MSSGADALSTFQGKAIGQPSNNRAGSPVTAFNPRGGTVSAEQNQAKAGELRRRLSPLTGMLVAADGCSPDLLHREEGVASELTLEEAREIA